MNFDISNADTVITGAGNGIGAACTPSFARRGARVLVTDIDATRAAQCSIGTLLRKAIPGIGDQYRHPAGVRLEDATWPRSR